MNSMRPKLGGTPFPSSAKLTSLAPDNLKPVPSTLPLRNLEASEYRIESLVMISVVVLDVGHRLGPGSARSGRARPSTQSS
jgi:hypothetical protein